MWELLTLHPYLEGKHFTLRTDHASLRSIFKLSDAPGKFQRWRLGLLEFEYDVVYLLGSQHLARDALSSPRTDELIYTSLEDAIPMFLPLLVTATKVEE